MRVIISGGGSGGHIYPAIAIAQTLKAKNPKVEILFVGAEGKMEMEKVPKAGFKIIGLNIKGFQRKFSFENIKNIFRIGGAVSKAKSLIKHFKPDIVIGVGGYASGPTLYVAQKMGIKTLIQEQNSYPGITNKFLSKRANKICVAYNGMESFFPKEKLVLSGNPVRKDIYQSRLSLNESREKFGLANKKTILLFGGSLGAKTLNEAVDENYQFWKDNPEIQLIWQIGKLYEDRFLNSKTASLSNVFPMTFIERMDMAYKAADIIICRAGALTISELGLVAKAAIFVPSPNVAEDHQTKNANALVQNDAALLVKDDEVKQKLFPLALDLIFGEKRQKALAKSISQFGKPNAANDICEEIIALANG